MHLDLSFRYCLLLVTTILVSVCESERGKKYQCHKRHSDKNQLPINVCIAPKKTRGEVCRLENGVAITVSPLLNKEEARRLQIIWQVNKVQGGDIIKLYKSPHVHHFKPIFEVVPYTPYGFSETNIFERFLDIGLKFETICMGYYIVYWRNSKILYSSCLQTNPKWMEEYKFGKMRLTDMFIPGTHDSSAYHTAYTPQNIGRLDNYVFTQEESILEQLLHGARALDLRVGKDEGVYYAHHGVAQLYPFQEVLNNITIFLDRTKEILLLDFHDFPIGFHDVKDHLEFVDHLYSQLGPYMASPELGWTATLQEIWDTGKHLIVAYNNPDAYATRKDILWPPITQMWGNVQNTTALYDYLTSAFNSPPEGMWSAQSELTAKAKDIATDDLGGLRKMATETNTQVSKWFRGEWGRQCHIVAMDFIRASSIVDVAIKWNMRKSFKKKCDQDAKKVQKKKIKKESSESSDSSSD